MVNGKIGLVALVSLLLISSPALVLAQGSVPNVPITSAQQFIDAINRVVNWAFVAFFALAVFFFLWAAFDYLRAAGDATLLGAAKNRVIYGIIAVVLAAIAKSLPIFIPTFLQ